MRFLVFIIIASLPFCARAFSLEDHKKIMLQALDEYERCQPGAFNAFDRFEFWTADLEEDVNVFRKDTVFSHYYNPTKTLQMTRQTSAVRVALIEKALDLFASSLTLHSMGHREMIAHAMHHIQDMAAPPHVVPVVHDLSDGFEKLEISGDLSSGWTCQAILQNSSGDLLKLLDDTALMTLANVDSAKFLIQRRTYVQNFGYDVMPADSYSSKLLTGRAFWEESSDQSFGQYGVLGNHYGEEHFVEGEFEYQVPAKFYEDFKREQLRIAVRATLRALNWYLALGNDSSAKFGSR